MVFVIFNRSSQKSSDKDIIIISKSYDDNSVSKLDELSENTDQSIIVNDDIDSKDYYPKHQFNNTSTDDNNNGDSELINNEDELNSKMEEINVAIKASQDPNAPNAPGAVIVEELGGLLFLDGLSYEQAPFIKVPPPIGSTKAAYKGTWSLLKEHEDYFRTERPHRLHIPHLAQPISRQEFHETFRLTSTPVIIPFEYMRHLGVRTRAWTLDELLKKFPFTPSATTTLEKLAIYSPKSGFKDGLDLGPALYALAQDSKLLKKGGFARNFPRNLMIKSKYLPMLEVSRPPFLDKSRFQAPTLWFVIIIVLISIIYIY